MAAAAWMKWLSFSPRRTTIDAGHAAEQHVRRELDAADDGAAEQREDAGDHQRRAGIEQDREQQADGRGGHAHRAGPIDRR